MTALTIFAALAVSLNVPPPDAFKPYAEDEGVTVEIARTAEGPPWIRGRCIIPADLERVAALLGNFAEYRKIFGVALRRADVLRRTGETTTLHVVWAFPLFYDDRDAIVDYTVEPRSNSAEVRVTWRGASATLGDPKSAGVRIEHVAGETIISRAAVREASPGTESAGATSLSYTYLGDLGGDFFDWVKEKAWKKQPVVYCQSVRAAILRGRQ